MIEIIIGLLILIIIPCIIGYAFPINGLWLLDGFLWIIIFGAIVFLFFVIITLSKEIGDIVIDLIN